MTAPYATMQTKTYFANNVPAAFAAARQDLGPDAMLLNSRPAPEEFRHLGRLEVIFAWEPSVTVGEKLSGLFDPPPSDMDEIRQQLASLRRAVTQKGAGVTESSEAPEALETRLTETGFSRDLAHEIVTAARSALTGDAREIHDEKIALQREFTKRMPVAPAFEVKTGETRSLALIGPPGRGKTTSMIKLAIRSGLAVHVPVRLYSAGVHRVGAREQTARYAAILGVPFQSFESLDGLNLALSGDVWKGLILIDTPGLAAADQAEMLDFAAFFTARPEIERHLVLRATERAADLLHAVERFAALAPNRLLFTGLDEASNLSSVTEILIRSVIPCGFTGTGQRIPEDLYDMDVVSLARRACEFLYPAPEPRFQSRAATAGG
jgi:flagellar biosynthesis protein FlhF